MMTALKHRVPHSVLDCLYAGPPLSSLIYDILLTFRVHKVALSGDIDKAFLNISVPSCGSMIPEANIQISKFTGLQELPLAFLQVPSC